MKRFTIIILTFVLLLLANVAFGASQGTLNVSPATVDPNGTVAATGGGFLSMADVTVKFDGDGAKVIKADIHGNISFSYDVPPSISKGMHSLSAQGPSSGTHPDDVREAYSHGSRVLVGSVNVVDKKTVLGEQVTPEQPVAPGAPGEPVVISVAGQLPYTGGTPLWALLMAGLALTVAGFGIKVIKRT
ncbi:MAG: LPXTG cell wall anchor domain-containing protein [Candidatus Aquicultor sp.]|nr:LPXTG cell wall anchor domain-containing protein [Candidatus Aquicultor sp.]